jgi:hypothetical protein
MTPKSGPPDVQTLARLHGVVKRQHRDQERHRYAERRAVGQNIGKWIAYGTENLCDLRYAISDGSKEGDDRR